MVHRWGLSPVLGYLAAGAVLGPLGLGSFVEQIPFLYWFTIFDAKNVAGIADLGVPVEVPAILGRLAERITEASTFEVAHG